MKAQKQVKHVQVIARIEFKADSRKVCYRVMSSNGDAQYTTCLFDGKATSCTCPASGRCYHETQIEQIERIRSAPTAKAATSNELKRVYDVRTSERRQSAPLAGASHAFSLMR